MAVAGVVQSDWKFTPIDKEWKSCGRKRVYLTRWAARRVAQRLNATVNKHNPIPAEDYRCPECRRYHVGHRMSEHNPEKR